MWNSNGLTNKPLELDLFVQNHHIDIMLVRETHFCTQTYFKLHGYDILQSNHPADPASNPDQDYIFIGFFHLLHSCQGI